MLALDPLWLSFPSIIEFREGSLTKIQQRNAKKIFRAKSRLSLQGDRVFKANNSTATPAALVTMIFGLAETYPSRAKTYRNSQ
jgi:hypothetical protein